MVTEPGLSWGWRKKGLQQIRVWGKELRDAGQPPEVFPLTSLMDVVLECRSARPTHTGWG